MHWHPDYAIYVVQGGSVTFYAKDGSKMESTLPSGASMVKPAEWHSAKNTGKTPIKVILFEVTRSGAISSPDAAMDATKVAPKLYKTVADTMGIRVLTINYKPGDQSAMHSHPDAGLYVIESSKSEFTNKDGSKQVMELPKGMAAISPAGVHSVKNVGKSPTKAILVEVFRAIK
jgi:quercetin dioxygenase-like cupin family protein